MDKWLCTGCGYIYDPAVGDTKGGVPPGTAFEDLPEGWTALTGLSHDFGEILPGGARSPGNEWGLVDLDEGSHCKYLDDWSNRRS